MKLNIIGRTITLQNKWYSVNNFKNEKVLIGANFNLRKFERSDIKKILLYTFMPYKWLDRKYLNSII